VAVAGLRVGLEREWDILLTTIHSLLRLILIYLLLFICLLLIIIMYLLLLSINYLLLLLILLLLRNYLHPWPPRIIITKLTRTAHRGSRRRRSARRVGTPGSSAPKP